MSAKKIKRKKSADLRFTDKQYFLCQQKSLTCIQLSFEGKLLQPGLFGDDPLAMIRLPLRSLSSQSLGKYC